MSNEPTFPLEADKLKLIADYACREACYVQTLHNV